MTHHNTIDERRSGDDRREDHDDGNLRLGSMSVKPAALAQLALWIVSVVLAYGALSTRIAVLETKYDALRAQLTDISTKLDRLLERPSK